MTQELIFLIEEAPEGGYNAEALDCLCLTLRLQ